MFIKFLVVLLQLSLIFASANYVPSSLDKVIGANHAVAPDFFNVIQKSSSLKNLIFSPLSVQVILALTRSGTKGTSEQQLGSALHLTYPQKVINEGYRKLLASFKTEKNCVIHSANKLYIKNGFKINPSFKKTAVGDYESEIENIDFSQKNNPAKIINSWVENHTAHKIKALIKPHSLNGNLKVILVNALYLSGKWSRPFKKSDTKSGEFNVQSAKKVRVQMMHQFGSFNYLDSKALNMTFLEMDLGNKTSDVSVIFILKNGPLSSNIAKTPDFTLKKVYDDFNMKSELVDVLLPKFKIESSIDFETILKSLGVADLFELEADLSGIAGEKGDLCVDKVLQKAFIDVNEDGLEAAAASAVQVSVSRSLKPVRKHFHADRPFYFVIMVKKVIAFAGRVLDPTL